MFRVEWLKARPTSGLLLGHLWIERLCPLDPENLVEESDLLESRSRSTSDEAHVVQAEYRVVRRRLCLGRDLKMKYPHVRQLCEESRDPWNLYRACDVH